MAKENSPFGSRKSYEEFLQELLQSQKPMNVPRPQPRPLAIYQFRIELLELAPAIWRRVQIPNDLSLQKLHRIIQSVFGWEEDHLHRFKIQKATYGVFDPHSHDNLDEKEWHIRDFGVRKGTKWFYEYDFGDSWQHTLVLEKVLLWQDNFVPVCLEGGRAAPPEDSGGAPGYWRKLQIMQDPSHPEHDAILEWMGHDWDPEKFDLEDANRKLKREFGHRLRPEKKKS